MTVETGITRTYSADDVSAQFKPLMGNAPAKDCVDGKVIDIILLGGVCVDRRPEYRKTAVMLSGSYPS